MIYHTLLSLVYIFHQSINYYNKTNAKVVESFNKRFYYIKFLHKFALANQHIYLNFALYR